VTIPTPIPAPPATDRERIVVLETEQHAMRARLREGAETFGALREELGAVSKQVAAELEKTRETIDEKITALDVQIRALAPKPAPLGRVLIAVAPIVLVLLGFVWGAARYPDRPEFAAVERRVAEIEAQIRLAVQDREVSRATLARIEAGLARIGGHP